MNSSQILHHRRVDGFKTIYTNNVLIGYSAYELTLVCSQSLPDAAGEPVVEEQVAVVMSLDHAKRLSQLLASTITEIERIMGPLRTVMPFKDKEVGQQGQ